MLRPPSLPDVTSAYWLEYLYFVALRHQDNLKGSPPHLKASAFQLFDELHQFGGKLMLPVPFDLEPDGIALSKP